MARTILETNRDVLDRLADELIECETIDVDRVQELFVGVEPFTSTGTGRPAAVAATDVSPTRRNP